MGEHIYTVQNNTLTELDTDRTYYKDTRPFDAETLDSLTEVYERGSGVNTQLIVRYPIGVHDLYLIEVLPNGPLQRQIPYLSASLIFSLAAILALGSALAFLLHRMIARPITALQSRIEAVGSGDFSADPAIEWDNELGDIGRGINRMSGNITALMDRRLEDEKQKQDLE